jgi:hypothetical protein
MKSNELGAILRAYSDILGRTAEGACIAALAQTFDGAGAETVAATLKRVTADRSAPLWERASESSSTLRMLRPLLSLIAKSTVAKDIDALLAALDRGPQDKPIRKAAGVAKTPRAASDPRLVDTYVRDLEAALGKEAEFRSVYEQLENDPRLSVADIRGLAKVFAKASAKSKADALKKIWARHQSLLSFAAKARATDGRSAA